MPHPDPRDIPVRISHLVKKMGAHDHDLYGHSISVSRLSWKFAVHLGFSIRDQRLIECAALLHDIGKLRIDPLLLQKPGALDENEWATMRTHPELGRCLLEREGIMNTVVLDVAQNHHERLDGTGYPIGLREKEISEIVRVITLCDVFTAMTEMRHYERSYTWRSALERMAGKGTRLDHILFRHFAAMIVAGQAVPSIQPDAPLIAGCSTS